MRLVRLVRLRGQHQFAFYQPPKLIPLTGILNVLSLRTCAIDSQPDANDPYCIIQTASSTELVALLDDAGCVTSSARQHRVHIELVMPFADHTLKNSRLACQASYKL